MKKSLITIFMSLVLFIMPIAIKAQETPMAFNVQGGYSWLNGVLGAEAQFGKLALSGGWMPCRMPISGEWINSYGGALTFYTLSADQMGESFYITGGIASAGYRYEDSWGYESTSPITIIMIGTKYNAGGVNCKVGAGYGWCEDAGAFAFEITLGFTIFGN